MKSLDPRYFVEAVAKSIDVLESFNGPAEELSTAEIVRRADITYCSAFRLLYTLEQRGYVMRVEGSKRFRLVQAQKRFRIGYAGMDQGCPYSLEISRSITQAARAQGMGLIVRDNELSPVRALANAEALLEDRVHLIVMHQPFDDMAAVVAARCREARVPLLTIDHAHPGSHYFGVNQHRAGRLAGQHLREVASGETRVLVLLPAPDNDSRKAFARGVVEGLRPGLGWNPSIEVLVVGGVRTDRYRGVRNLLKEAGIVPGRVLVASACDGLAAAAGRALANLGCESTPIVGLGGSSERIARLRRADLSTASVACFPETYGDRLVRMATRILEGEKSSDACYTEHVLLTSANLSQYYPDTRQCGPVQAFRNNLQLVEPSISAAV